MSIEISKRRRLITAVTFLQTQCCNPLSAAVVKIGICEAVANGEATWEELGVNEQKLTAMVEQAETRRQTLIAVRQQKSVLRSPSCAETICGTCTVCVGHTRE